MTHPTNRRDFLATAATAAVLLPNLTSSIHAAGNGTLKVGLIGCGNRGTGAAEQALAADKDVKLVAMGDMFADKLEDSLKTLSAGSMAKAAMQLTTSAISKPGQLSSNQASNVSRRSSCAACKWAPNQHKTASIKK